MPLDDSELMRRAQGGDLRAFDEIATRYRRPLLRAALSKLGHAAWAEDVVQETLLAAYAARQSFDPAFALRTWLWTILLNLCKRQWQRRAARPQELPAGAWNDPAELAREPVSAGSGLEQLLVAERRAQLSAWLATLPEVQADALRLRFFGELKFQEIAAVMDSSVSAAKVRVKQGLQALAARARAEGESL